jgi:hypothetical protein
MESATRDETTMLTITVKHSFSMKSKVILRLALLESKFAALFSILQPIPTIPSEI